MESNRLVWEMVKPVIERALPDETPSMRLQQVAVLMTIYALEAREEVVTAQMVTEAYGLSRAQTHRLVTSLVEKGVLHAEQTHNRLGRGRSTALKLIETPEFAALKAVLTRQQP
ncbi:helix-turn-helix domain-containing protein [Mesorhizobium sp. YIM 152430]|uniref:helix-turn-helix domain-containing protein n=1 Tax=Mesorhizobium sp. YIM 152430 TaxID=3031761 RepID=UPI0023DB629E|nr:helix-turn-helix domain-containing protein [Mesorhizobium sp. YIM 152430]MDF1599534.1 helix-turn-helix domain-containing protein [Mesorhizobium sp. YIM 152430]